MKYVREKTYCGLKQGDVSVACQTFLHELDAKPKSNNNNKTSIKRRLPVGNILIFVLWTYT